MSHWLFVLAAYVLTAGVLLTYWRWVEHRVRVLETLVSRRGSR